MAKYFIITFFFFVFSLRGQAHIFPRSIGENGVPENPYNSTSKPFEAKDSMPQARCRDFELYLLGPTDYQFTYKGRDFMVASVTITPANRAISVELERSSTVEIQSPWPGEPSHQVDTKSFTFFDYFVLDNATHAKLANCGFPHSH